MTDEAHRSHYGIYETVHYEKHEEGELSPVFKYGVEKYIRDALPNATFIGFTGTPISNKDKQTTDVFGDIIDVYDMTQSIIDGSTVKLYYESRLAKIWTNEDVLKKIDDYYEDIEKNERGTPEAVEKSKRDVEAFWYPGAGFHRRTLCQRHTRSLRGEEELPPRQSDDRLPEQKGSLQALSEDA